MFRDGEKTKLDNKHFGAGGLIGENKADRWLVVADGNKSVKLLDLQTFELCENSINVDDPNWLTQDEVRKLVILTKKNYTLSDFSLSSSGLKNFSF